MSYRLSSQFRGRTVGNIEVVGDTDGVEVDGDCDGSDVGTCVGRTVGISDG